MCGLIGMGWVAVRLAGITTMGKTRIRRCGCMRRVPLVRLAGTVMCGGAVAISLISCVCGMASLPARCGSAFWRVNGSKEGDGMARKHGGAAVRPPLDQMTLDELWSWVRQTRAALQQKMQREQAYLARRASRGIRTPTDEAYEADALLEADLLAMLDEMEQIMSRQG